MIGKTIVAGCAMIAVVLGSAALLGQPQPAPQTFPSGLEFPVTMRQNVIAGKTPVGAKVQAKLAVATLLHGVVVPPGAIFSGEVTESVAKSATAGSRLAICMDSVQWKSGSQPMKVYLTAWYHPMAMPAEDLSSGLPDAANDPRLRTGGAFPGARNPTAPPGPSSSDSTRPATGLSQRRLLMKNVESTHDSNGAITLTSRHSNIKLDKQTTYVLAGDMLPAR